MRRVLAVALAAVAVLPAVAIAAPTAPSPWPSCSGTPAVKTTVTKRVGGAATAGTISFTSTIVCGNPQLALSLTDGIYRNNKLVGKAVSASCATTASSVCDRLTVTGQVSVPAKFAGQYELHETLTQKGADWQVAHAQRTAGVWSDPCTHDTTWLTVSCTGVTLVKVK